MTDKTYELGVCSVDAAAPDMKASRRLLSLAAPMVAFVLDLVVYLDDAWDTDGEGVRDWSILVLLVLVYLVLVLRPRWTIRTLIAMVGFGLIVGVADPLYSPFAGVCVALFRVAERCAADRVWAALLLASAPFALNLYNSLTDGGYYSPEAVVILVLIWILLLAIPWILGRARFAAIRGGQERERLQLVAAEAELQSERLRLARELHDIISHSVSAMILQAAGARAGEPDEARMRTTLEAVETTGVQAMRELHRLLGLLRSVEEANAEAVPGAGLETLHDLDPLLATVRACDVDVVVESDGSPRPLDPSIEHAAYRVVQECLANVIKHAGRQAAARVHISWEATQLRISVRSTPGLVDQVPRPDLSTGLGLRGLRERIDLVGGQFEAGPSSDGTFLACAALPFVRTAEPSTAIESR